MKNVCIGESIKYSSSFTVHVVSGSSAEKTEAGQKIKGLRILLKPHVLYGWLLLVIGLMHGIMAGKNPGMISGKLVWMVLPVLLLAACLKSRMKKSVWMFLHRSLSVVFAAGIVFHIAYAVIF